MIFVHVYTGNFSLFKRREQTAMKLNVKAALLSAFVLPGLGQLYKGNRLKGVVLILLVNVFLLLALFVVLRGMGPFILAAKTSGTVEPAKVAANLQSSSPAARLLLAAFFGLWLYGFIDALLDKTPPE